jgi:hypothetical protein
MRLKFNLFMRSNLFINIWQFWSGGRQLDHEIKIQKSIIRNFDLMMDLLVTSTIMRSKFKINYLNLVSPTCGKFLALIISHLCISCTCGDEVDWSNNVLSKFIFSFEYRSFEKRCFFCSFEFRSFWKNVIWKNVQSRPPFEQTSLFDWNKFRKNNRRISKERYSIKQPIPHFRLTNQSWDQNSLIMLFLNFDLMIDLLAARTSWDQNSKKHY